MIIIAAINLLLLIILYMAVMLFSKREKSIEYDYRTTLSKSLKVIINVFFITFGIGPSAGAIFVIAGERENSSNLALLIVSICFGLFSLLLLYLIYSQFEAIKDEYIYIRRFVRKKKIAIEDVKSIDTHSNGYVVLCKHGHGFTLDKRTVGADEFIKLIQERTNVKIYSVSCDAPVNKSDDKTELNDEQPSKEHIELAEIGKAFRENSYNYKRKQVITISVVISVTFLLIIVGGLLLFFLGGRPGGIVIVVLSLPLCFFYLIVPSRIKENIDKDLKHDDEWLGNKYKLQNPKVKGAARSKFIPRIMILSSLLGCCLIVGAISGGISFSQKVVQKSYLTLISGEFEYIRNVSDDYAIGLIGDSTEYRLSSIDVPRFDQTFKNEVKIGDTIKFLINANEEKTSINYNQRTSWTYVYEIETESNIYFSYDDYVYCFNKNKNDGITCFIVCASLISVSLIGFIVSFAIYSHESKKETIDV